MNNIKHTAIICPMTRGAATHEMRQQLATATHTLK